MFSDFSASADGRLSSQDPEPRMKPRLPGGHWAIEISAQQKTSVRFWQVPSYIDGPLGFRLAKLSARKFWWLGGLITPSKYKSSFYGRIFLTFNGPSHPSRSSFNIEHGPFHWCFPAPCEHWVLPLQRLQAFGAFQWIGGKVGGLGGLEGCCERKQEPWFLEFFYCQCSLKDPWKGKTHTWALWDPWNECASKNHKSCAWPSVDSEGNQDIPFFGCCCQGLGTKIINIYIYTHTIYTYIYIYIYTYNIYIYNILYCIYIYIEIIIIIIVIVIIIMMIMIIIIIILYIIISIIYIHIIIYIHYIYIYSHIIYVICYIYICIMYSIFDRGATWIQWGNSTTGGYFVASPVPAGPSKVAICSVGNCGTSPVRDLRIGSGSIDKPFHKILGCVQPFFCVNIVEVIMVNNG